MQPLMQPSMRTSRTRALPALLSMAALLSLAAARPASAQTHVYTLNNTYADANSGPSLVPNGSTGTGTLSSSGYTFAANQGLGLTNALTDPGNYSISLTFSLTDVISGNGYKKLIDFKNLTSDNGLYLLNGVLDFYPTPLVATTVIAANQSVTVNLTRNSATHLLTGSVNGVQQFSFADTDNNAVFSTTNGQINFFQDDTVTGQREASGGTVTNITLNAPAVPEASTTVSLGLLLALGMGGVIVARKKKTA